MSTRGEVLKEKFTNFYHFCMDNLPMTLEQRNDFKVFWMLETHGAGQLMWMLQTHLLPVKDLVFARDVDGIKKQMHDDGMMWISTIDTLDTTDVEVQDKTWRYLELFCELSSFSEPLNKDGQH